MNQSPTTTLKELMGESYIHMTATRLVLISEVLAANYDFNTINLPSLRVKFTDDGAGKKSFYIDKTPIFSVWYRLNANHIPTSFFSMHDIDPLARWLKEYGFYPTETGFGAHGIFAHKIDKKWNMSFFDLKDIGNIDRNDLHELIRIIQKYRE